MQRLLHRSNALELMDDLTCSGAVVKQTLKELDFINRWLGGDIITLRAVDAILVNTPVNQSLVIADLGCGSGSILSSIFTLAKKRNRSVKLIGIDANKNIIDYARETSGKNPSIEFIVMDVFSEEFSKMKFDVVIGTLFFHHFTNQQLANLFAQLSKQVKIGILVNDIHRHPIAYYLIKWLTRIFSKSDMVKYDAPLSVSRAFTKKDWKTILPNDKLSFTLQWKWAFRWKLIVQPSQSH